MKKLIYTAFSTLSMFFFGTVIFAGNVLAQTYRYGTNYDVYDRSAGAFGGIFGLIVSCCGLIFGIAIYVFIALQISKIFKKNGLADKSVMAFIPFANVYYLAKSVDESDNNALLFALSPLLGFIPCIGGIASIVVIVMLWVKVARKQNVEEIWGILTFVPILNLFAIYKIAEGDAKASTK